MATSPINAKPGRRAPYAQLPDWVALSGASTGAQIVYWRLTMHVNHERGDGEVWPTRETLADLCGWSQPHSIDPYIAELTELGAIERTIVRHGKNKMERRTVYTVHETPPPGYTGLHSLQEYYKKTKPQVTPEVQHTVGPEVQHTVGPEVQHTVGKPHEPQPDELKPHQPPRVCAREEVSEGDLDVGGGGNPSGDGGVLGMVGEMADAMALSSGPNIAGEEQVPSPPASVSRALLERLRAQDGAGLSARAVREFEPLVARLLEHHKAADITSHLTSGIRGGGGIRYRLNQLATGKTTIETSDSSSPSPAAPSVVPPWCGECEGNSRDHWSSRVVVIEGTRRRKCPQCHPHVAAVAG